MRRRLTVPAVGGLLVTGCADTGTSTGTGTPPPTGSAASTASPTSPPPVPSPSPEGAERMAEELGEGVGVLVTDKGEGHGPYGTSACATRTVDAYLLGGRVPAHGTTCG